MLNLTGQTVAVLGAGRSGLAAARLAAHCGATVSVYDSRGPEAFANIPTGIARHPHACAESAPVTDLVVTSPGIETGGEFVQAFAQRSGALWGEIELAYRCYSGRIIGITGTNGKTTTTELVEVLVKATGKTCLPCGNYGTPFAEVVMADEVPEVVALELSSFQLETIVSFKPDVAIWLNFAADHMDRYHDLMAYFEAKQQIFNRVTSETPVIIRQGETLLSLPGLKGKVTTFSSSEEADWSLMGDWIHKNGEPFLPLSETRLRGLHNAENLMAACAAVSGLTPEIAGRALADYQPPAHRCELVCEREQVEWINDSKATNLHALESALRAFTRPIILLAGGKEKGLDYRALLPVLGERARRAIFFGQIGPKLSELCSAVLESESVATLPEAVVLAHQYARSGELVLLSPGTSSFDQYPGYEERGEEFRKAVLSLN